mgnify:CR=1 FL=1
MESGLNGIQSAVLCFESDNYLFIEILLWE